MGSPALPKPGRKELLDVAAAAWAFQAGADDLVLDDDERRKRLDREALEQVGSRILLDAVELERLVVAAPLEHLREESLDTSTVARNTRMEEHEPRLRGPGFLRCYRSDRRQFPPPRWIPAGGGSARTARKRTTRV